MKLSFIDLYTLLLMAGKIWGNVDLPWVLFPLVYFVPLLLKIIVASTAKVLLRRSLKKKLSEKHSEFIASLNQYQQKSFMKLIIEMTIGKPSESPSKNSPL